MRDLVRDLHDRVARSPDPAEASTRPADTLDLELGAMYRDVVSKLGLTGRERVLEIGCGVGLLAPHIASRSAEYVGVDFAPEAIAVARDRVARGPAAERCSFKVVDVLDGPDEDLATSIGQFDRVLLYAVLHYSRNDADGRRFMRVAIRCLRPGGLALFGNLPLEDLREDIRTAWLVGRGRYSRMVALARWVVRGNEPYGRSVRWKAAAAAIFVAKSLLRRIRKPRAFTAAALPPGYCLELRIPLVESWVAATAGAGPPQWLAPNPLAPLALSRADLLIIRAS